MKNLANFDAFKLTKGQMNAVAGGMRYSCTYDFGDGDTFTDIVNSEYSKVETEGYLEGTTHAIVTCVDLDML